MKVNELRIGNWISYPQTADIARAGYYIGQVSEISEKHNTINIKDYILAANFKLLQCKAIPLTEEWLLKFGFQIPKDGLFGKQNYLYKEEECGTGVDTIRIYNSGGKFFYEHSIIEINFVHQLQNLYYALTGNELTLTPAKEEMK